MKKSDKIACFITVILMTALIISLILVLMKSHNPHPAGPIAFNSDGDPLILNKYGNIKILSQDGSNKKWFSLRNLPRCPVDMVLDSGFSGKLYLLDDQKITEFDRNGDKLAEFGWWRRGSGTNGDLKGGNGHLYFANTALGKVQVFDLYNGDPENKEFDQEMYNPLSLDIDRKGDLYVLTASRYEAEQGFELRRYNLKTSKFQGSWEVPQSEFKQPLHIAIDRLRDWLYVAYDNGYIHKFTLDGVWAGASNLNLQKGDSIINLVTNEHGYVFAVCRDKIVEINPFGAIVTQWK